MQVVRWSPTRSRFNTFSSYYTDRSSRPLHRRPLSRKQRSRSKRRLLCSKRCFYNPASLLFHLKNLFLILFPFSCLAVYLGTPQAAQPTAQQQKVTYATTPQLQPGIKTQFFTTSIAQTQKPATAQQIQVSERTHKHSHGPALGWGERRKYMHVGRHAVLAAIALGSAL